MTTDALESDSRPRKTTGSVALSKWVNEKLPAWDEILSAHDVARLTRRRQWVVYALALFGRFPKQQRFHGRAIGWAKRDVLNCLSNESACRRQFQHTSHRANSRESLQQTLPMHFPRSRRMRGPCASTRNGRKS